MNVFRPLIRSLGPAIIVASIVLGPGSILISSKVGCQFGYSMLWALLGAVVLMMAMTALGAHLGVIYPRTLCQEAAHRWNRGVAAAIGVTLFLIVACFQVTNNVAVLAAIEGLWPAPEGATDVAQWSGLTKAIALAVLNGVIIATLYGFRQLYRPLELLMIMMVGSMLLAFSINLALAQPSLAEVAAGLVPSIRLTPPASPAAVPANDQFLALLSLMASTFSVAGAFYQSYLVKEKGWTLVDMRKGLTDSLLGIAVLGLVSAIIMITSAAALHGVIAPEELDSTSDIARQLEPLFGVWASTLFAAGIFAASFSSFLGNALIGGTMLSDGFNLGSSIDQPWPKRFTTVALLSGMLVAIATVYAGANSINVIVFAQALTVLGVPALAFLMLYLGVRAGRDQGHRVPTAIMAIAMLGGVVAVALALRTAYRLWVSFA